MRFQRVFLKVKLRGRNWLILTITVEFSTSYKCRIPVLVVGFLPIDFPDLSGESKSIENRRKL